ncbi:hypothetical protein HHK36_016187 [Tetracentron sinense]|uniref:DUF3741 domain-containing protein n=1 Tax=Tetracentron sinense TaxID=13715 RepID=A0A834Z0X0_TETSI|nr:hypothetical protein HHK36_016187 [Tetracentron sinense]
MKISSSSSSSSSSPSSFDANFTNSRNPTPRCLSGILRRLLCTGSLPTHPSDHILEPDKVECDLSHEDSKVEKKIEDPAVPGLVARLMGLDSLPERTPGSISRSRSVNSAGCWSDIDPMQGMIHRRVRTSLSFREVPTFLQLENEDFFFLSFENLSETKELGLKGKKSEMGFRELKQRRAERSENKENRREKLPEKKIDKKKEDRETNKKVCSEREKPRKKISDKASPSRKFGNGHEIKESGSTPKPRVTANAEDPSKPTNHRQVSGGAKFAKKKKNGSAVKKVEAECNSENSSPVSVLDIGDFLNDTETPLSEENLRSNSRRKLSSELVNLDYPSPHFTSISIANDRELTTIKTKDTESRNMDYHSGDGSEFWGEICKLAEEDTKVANWMSREMLKLEDFQEICIEFGVIILDRLLHEVVDELSGFP